MIIIAILTSFLLTTSLEASFFKYDDPPLGWFWYREMKEGIEKKLEDKIETEKDNKAVKTEEIKQQPELVKEKDDQYIKDPKWAHLPVDPDAPHVIKQLLYNPTLQNAKEYLKWLGEINNRASLVADLVQRAYVEEGDILYPTSTPRSQIGATAIAMKEEVKKKKDLSYAINNVGLIYFWNPDCPACNVQTIIIKRLKDSGFSIKAIHPPEYRNPDTGVEGVKSTPDTGISSFFGIREVPSLVVVSDKTRTYRLVGRGVTTYEEIIRRILNYIEEEVENVKVEKG